MLELLLLALALGFDSCRVSLTLGAAGTAVGRQLRIALAFGVCDGLALVLGVALGRSLVSLVGQWADRFEPSALGAYALFVVWLARSPREETETPSWLVVGLPLSLSFDNLVVGATLGGPRLSLLPVAGLVGAVSGLMALSGLALGRMSVRLLRLRPELVGAALLLLASVSSVREDPF
jgi:putative Mn2+ efflux pump MntP